MSESPGSPKRKILQIAVSSILLEAGFDSAEKHCVETLTEMLQAFLVEIGQSSRNYTELSGRVSPTIGDVVVALANMGINLDGIREFSRRESRHIIPLPQQASQQKHLNLLQAGTKQSHPSHIPHHLPALPDSHSYIRTPVSIINLYL